MEDHVILEAINNASKRNETALRDFQSQISTSLARLEIKIDEHKCPDIIQQTEKLNTHVRQGEKFQASVTRLRYFLATLIIGIAGILAKLFIK